MGSTPGQGTKIPHATQLGQKKKGLVFEIILFWNSIQAFEHLLCAKHSSGCYNTGAEQKKKDTCSPEKVYSPFFFIIFLFIKVICAAYVYQTLIYKIIPPLILITTLSVDFINVSILQIRELNHS